jgi:hypothetical protein
MNIPSSNTESNNETKDHRDDYTKRIYDELLRRKTDYLLTGEQDIANTDVVVMQVYIDNSSSTAGMNENSGPNAVDYSSLRVVERNI